jgi:hypothetical protein
MDKPIQLKIVTDKVCPLHFCYNIAQAIKTSMLHTQITGRIVATNTEISVRTQEFDAER